MLFLLLCSHVSYAQDQAEPPNDAPVATVPAEAEIPPPPVSEQNQEDTEVNDPVRDFSAEDLAVQERMAEAAEEVNLLVKRQNCIAIIGLVFVSAATFFAGMAWRAGSDAVKVTREIGNSQLRAYLAINTCSIMLIRDTDKPCYAVTFNFTNVGQTPAFNIKIRCVPFSSQNRMEPDEPPPEVTESEKIVAGYLPQGRDSKDGFFVVQGVELIGTEDGFGNRVYTDNSNLFIIARGIIEFDDIYTIANSKLPKRKVIFYRYITNNKVSHSGIVPMTALEWKETAT